MLMKTHLKEPRPRANGLSPLNVHRFQPLHSERRTILLISNDEELHEELRALANEAGLMVVRVHRSSGTAEVLRGVRPGAVVLDLDLPGDAAWKSADVLLNEPDCPAVLLLTGRTGQMAVQSAIGAGLLVGKGDSPGQLLHIIEDAMDMPGPDQAERNALRRELIRWLRPPAWEADPAPAYRFWGINE